MSVSNGQISVPTDIGIIAGLKKHLDIIFELGKIKITFFVAFSTSIGYILFWKNLTWDIIPPAIGVFLLACGSSAVNHFQERKTDALMERTKNRPLPSGRISENYAIALAAMFVFTGSGLIYLSANTTALVLGWSTLAWYNFIYTPMKKRNALAVVPGSLIGALPPVIGYVAAGGSPYDPQILSLALFFFIWQIPHFWLLLLMLGNDYAKAGFPTLTEKFSDVQLTRITYMWIAALAVSCLLIPAFNVSSSMLALIALIVLGGWLLFDTKKILDKNILGKVIYRKAFMSVNLYVLAVVLIISFDKLFH